MTTVRKATLDDIDDLEPLMLQYHQESAYRGYSYDRSKVVDLLRNLIENDHPVLVVGEPIWGYLIAVVQQQWFGQDLEAFDLCFYVTPEHRGGPSAVKLVSAYLRSVEERGVTNIQLGMSSGINGDSTKRFYRKMGFDSVMEGFRYGRLH